MKAESRAEAAEAKCAELEKVIEFLQADFGDKLKFWSERAEAADAALQKISLILGGTDEWTDQATMIHYVVSLAEEAGNKS
jgi:hypothetical protein